jgi:hypothetical protein
VRGGAWAEAVIVVSAADELAQALDRVQRALAIDWEPSTVAGLPDLAPEQVRDALIATLEFSRPLVRSPLPPRVLGRAAELRAEHAL